MNKNLIKNEDDDPIEIKLVNLLLSMISWIYSVF